MTYTAVIGFTPANELCGSDNPQIHTLSEHRFNDLDECVAMTIERLNTARAEVPDDMSFLNAMIVIGDDPWDFHSKSYLIEETDRGFEFDASGPY